MPKTTTVNPNLVLPVGTQVVSRIEILSNTAELICPQGAVGAIVRSPDDNSHAYRVRLPNGQEITLRRHEFTIRKHFQREGLEPTEDWLADFNLYDSVIYRCVVGSRAYGLDDENSDTDRRGIYLPPAELHWSLYGVPEQLENKSAQECYWELQKFLILALKANPNVLECLYTPLIETASPIATELLSIRHIFLSKLVYQTYNSYVISQFKKLEQDLRMKGEIRWKHAMHLIRLLLSGITVLRAGFVPVRVDDYRDRLLAIKYEHLTWEEVNAWRLQLHQDFDRAFADTQLPDRPDYEQANLFLIRARHHRVEQ
ncbi:nucleotidyltransferase domain-containing protein [Pantanalinema sp. GBBB05]|uniref:nucleotidyltransferase domain-containing protein n=1 Tax=Pantanalinema sp. GBBB05 TaxID=2604139 RepID=UPI001E029545|nr:nucleotidyltransferase domain-containing protein [Pantanalinema sp. GBBB05]